LLRYIEILFVSPWKVGLGEESGFRLSPTRVVQVANPASFLTQKILIHDQRDHREKAKDLLYVHDTVELFSENLDEMRQSFRNDIVPHLHPRRVSEVEEAADRLFGKVDDAVREASLMATRRRLVPERLAETAGAGLKEIFEVEKRI
jgi:Nucleotidyltransferase